MGGVHYLVVFNSINCANYLESELRKYGYEVEIIQTPEQLDNSDYNISLKFYQDALDFVMERITEDHLKPYKICKYYYNNGKRTYIEFKSKNEEYDEELLNMLFGEGDDLEEEDIVDDIEADEIEETIEIDDKIKIDDEEDNDEEDNIEADNNTGSDEYKYKEKSKQKYDPIELIRKLYKLSRRK